jgi:hypothetical protein
MLFGIFEESVLNIKVRHHLWIGVAQQTLLVEFVHDWKGHVAALDNDEFLRFHVNAVVDT